jgi:hypothetical protein
MKKSLALALLILTTGTVAYSQQDKGDVNVAFSGTYTSNKLYSFGQIFIKGGYFVTKNIEAGIKPQFLFGDGFSGSGVGLYGTYNFLTKDAKLVPYAGLEINHSSLKSGGGGEESGKMKQTNMGLYGGSKYFITESLNVDAGLNLSFNLASNPSEMDLGTIFQFQVGVGFIVGNVNKKKVAAE